MYIPEAHGEFLGVVSCAITVNLVTLYITEINLSLSLSLSIGKVLKYMDRYYRI